MAVVVLDTEEFRALYPMLASMTDVQLNAYFGEATMYVNNTESSNIPYDPPGQLARKYILYAVMCHLITLAERGSGVVGTVTSAQEGSVSASITPILSNSGSDSWWNQTACGAKALELIRIWSAGGRFYPGCFR